MSIKGVDLWQFQGFCIVFDCVTFSFFHVLSSDLMNSAESQFHGLSRKKIAELKRKAEKKEKNKAYYEKNRENLIEKVKEKRRQSWEAVRSQTRGSIKKAEKRSKAKEISQSISYLWGNMKRSLHQCKSCIYLLVMVKKNQAFCKKPANLCNLPRPQGIMGNWYLHFIASQITIN